MTVEAFLTWAKENDWQVELSEQERDLPNEAFRRYRALPPDYLRLLQRIQVLSNKADTTWFLSIDNFKDTASDTPWQVDSFEKISLEAADGDNELTAAITRFWDEHISIVFRLASGYEYYAIRLADGAVVNGIEPEFEEVSAVAPSFEAFLTAIIAGSILL